MIKEQIKKDVSNILKKYYYERRNSETYQNVAIAVAKYLTNVKDNKKIYDFNVICDDVTNTKDILDRNELVCRLALKFFPNDKKFTVIDCILGLESVKDFKGVL